MLSKIERVALYERAIKKWGEAAQIDIAVEECAELIKALVKCTRKTNGSTIIDILEEMADVEIMLEQLKLIFNYDFQFTIPTSKFYAIKDAKLKRLEKRLNGK